MADSLFLATIVEDDRNCYNFGKNEYIVLENSQTKSLTLMFKNTL